MNRRRGAGAAWRRANMSLWLWPSVAVAAAYAVGFALSARPWGADSFAGALFQPGATGGRAVLTALVGGLVTALSVIFSLTITGLQLVHQQYSPRLLRNFIRDRPTKVTLGVFAGTAAYMLAVLRAMPPSDSDAPVPRLAIFVGMMLFLGCVGIVAYFAQHIANAIRVHRAMDRVAADTRHAIDLAERKADGRPGGAMAAALPAPAGGAVIVDAWRSGYVCEIDIARLVAEARRGDAAVRLQPMIGDHVVEGTPVAWIWSRGGDPSGIEDLRRALPDAIEIGPDRTEDTDISYGLRQLVDVAVRAMSPSLNDPYTAIQAIDHMTVILCRLASRGLSDGVTREPDGAVLVVAPTIGLTDYVRLAVDQPRRYGAQEPAVAVRLLALVRAVGIFAPPDARARLRDEVERIRGDATDRAMAQDDLDPVHDEAEAALAALAGGPIPQAASSVRL